MFKRDCIRVGMRLRLECGLLFGPCPEVLYFHIQALTISFLYIFLVLLGQLPQPASTDDAYTTTMAMMVVFHPSSTTQAYCLQII